MRVDLTSIYRGGITSHASGSEAWNAASCVMNGGGSPPSPPAAPPPPDYASANRAGIMTDVASLGTRKAVENASIFGGSVKNYGVEERYDENGKPYYVQLYDEDGDRLKTPRTISRQEAFQTFDDSNSTIAATEKLADWQRGQRDEEAQSLYDLGEKYGDKYIDMAKEFMERLDPEGTANRQQLGREVGQGLERMFGTGPAIKDITNAISQEKISNQDSLKDLEAAGQYSKIGDAKSTEKLSGNGPEFQRGTMEDGGGMTAQIRGRLEQEIMDNLASGEELTDSQSRSIEREMRAAQIKRGNAYGPAASAQEIAAKYDFGTKLGQQRRAEALGLLSSGQSSFDTASKLRQEGNQLSQKELENELTALAQRNQASQVDYDNLMSRINQNNQATQQDFNNKTTQTQFNNANIQQAFASNLAAIGQRNAASQQDYANQMAQTTFNNQAAQSRFSNELTTMGQRNSVTQQNMANRMAFAGLQPVGAIAAATAGAAASPVPNTPSAQLMNLLSINPNAGSDAAKFALGVFDTQSSNYRSLLGYQSSNYATQQQYNSPLSWVQGVGGAIGSANPFSFKF